MSANHSIIDKLRQSSLDLLDLSTKNRLIHTPRTRSRSTRVEILGAEADDAYARLVGERKTLTFIAGEQGQDDEDEEDNGEIHLAQPDDDEPASMEGRGRQRTNSLPTNLTSEALQKRLLALYRDASNYEEEQGVNILFLAVGFLR